VRPQAGPRSIVAAQFTGARQTQGTAPSSPYGPVCRRSRTRVAIPGAAPGTYTQPVVRCPTCGEQNSDTARFCQNCGSPLVRAAAPEERKVVSILFVDLVEFTSRSDQADPEDVRAMLMPYHTRVKSEDRVIRRARRAGHRGRRHGSVRRAGRPRRRR
jgi:hypothetical protein